MSEEEEIRNAMAREMLCCFTCHYCLSLGLRDRGNGCYIDEKNPKRINANSLCVNWKPDLRDEAIEDWDELLKNRRSFVQ